MLYLNFPCEIVWIKKIFNQTINIIKKITQDNRRYNNEHRDFYLENSHANYGDKKPWDLRLLIQIHYMRSNYTYLLDYFTLKSYFPGPTYNLIHVHNIATSDYSSEYSSTSLKGCRSSSLDYWMNPLNERLRMMWLIRIYLHETFFQSQQ